MQYSEFGISVFRWTNSTKQGLKGSLLIFVIVAFWWARVILMEQLGKYSRIARINATTGARGW